MRRPCSPPAGIGALRNRHYHHHKHHHHHHHSSAEKNEGVEHKDHNHKHHKHHHGHDHEHHKHSHNKKQAGASKSEKPEKETQPSSTLADEVIPEPTAAEKKAAEAQWKGVIKNDGGPTGSSPKVGGGGKGVKRGDGFKSVKDPAGMEWSGWEELEDEEGSFYYRNDMTGETQVEPPWAGEQVAIGGRDAGETETEKKFLDAEEDAPPVFEGDEGAGVLEDDDSFVPMKEKAVKGQP